MPKIALKHLKAHPAQMRTTYDLEALAALTLQLYERGLDDWQPIVASPHPGLSGAEGGEGFHIVSGHRRHMAQLLAFALRDWAKERPDTEIDIEAVRTMLTGWVESLGSLEQVITYLLTHFGDEEISFVTFEGSQKAQILALQSANYGSEKPDILGVAHSFRQALEAGATAAEIARNVGQHVQYVLNHVALAHIPPELAQRIAAGELPMSVAVTVADLSEPKRTGLAIFILANEPGKLTAKAIKECAATLKKWPGPQMPLMAKHQSQRNVARALVRLWGQAVELYPEDAYAAAAMFIYRGVQEEPWGTQEKLTLWFQALGGDTYFSDGRINWTAVVEYLLTELSCESCPIAQLPKQSLLSDLSQGQGGPLGMPCRVGEPAHRCIHGLAPNDNFDCRVPWEWSQHPGVVNEGGEYRAKSVEALRQAWQAQAEKEQAEGEAADTSTVDTATVDDKQPTAEEPPRKANSKRPSTGDGQQPDDSPSPTPPVKDSGNPTESPVFKQRSLIADFMKRHEQVTVNHPFATPCGRCRHRLEASPTKDEAVPHCAWAGRPRSVAFKVLMPGIEDAPHIPVCRQFAPHQPWPETIPAHPAPPGIPRDWLKEQILHLVKDANRHGSERNAFEFLTGRPMGANENYGEWFSQQLDAQGGDLSDAQLFTLFVWAHAEWRRANGKPFSLPVNGHSMQFTVYDERPWPIQEAA